MATGLGVILGVLARHAVSICFPLPNTNSFVRSLEERACTSARPGLAHHSWSFRLLVGPELNYTRFNKVVVKSHKIR
jgi:hypothetical protein